MTKKFETFTEFMSGARRGRPLTNSIGLKTMTRDKLKSLILQGFGQGRNGDYLPLIRVTRGNAPRVSNHAVMATSCSKRPLHLMSRWESRAVCMALWLQCAEIREQFPLWPWEGSPHPMAGLDPDRDSKLSVTPGLLAIAAKAGINHGTYVGASDLPYVATVDLAIRVGRPPNDRLVFWSVKPASILADKTKGPRAKERIELERLYADAVGAHHALYDGRHETGSLLANLDWLRPTFSELADTAIAHDRAAFAHAFNETDADQPIKLRIEQVACGLGVALPAAQAHFRTAAWQGVIDADLRHPVMMSRPLRTGGAMVKQALARELLGGVM